MREFELIFDENDDNEQNVGVYSISLVDDPAIGVMALQFSNENNEDSLILNEDLINNLKKYGKTPLKYQKEWSILRVDDVDDLDIDNDLTFNSEDNNHFQIRYRYEGKTDSKSRDFCKTLMSWNREWTLDDINLLDDLNPALAPRGKSSYSILKYKGGISCRHRWQRIVYFENEALTYEEALKKMPKNLVKQIKKLPKEVGEIANSSNNYWRLNFSNEKERILTQPILIPEQRIFRKSVEGQPANVFVTAETIKKYAINFAKQGFQNNSYLHHDEIIEGVTTFESWIIEDPQNDKSNSLGFKDLPKGTWMVSMKINNDEVWKRIESNEITGLSVDIRPRLKKVEKAENEPIKFKKENLKMNKKETFLSRLKQNVRLAFSAENTVVDSEKGYQFAGTEPVGSTLVDENGDIVADFTFTFNEVEYKSNAEGIIDIVAVEDEVELEEDAIEVEDLEDAIEVVKEEADAKIEELTEKVEELIQQVEEKEAELVELRKQSPKKIGFSKQTAEPKNESLLEMARRLRK